MRYLKRYELVYLASPYTKLKDRDAACREVCIAAAEMMRAGVRVFSPIAHSHTIAMLSGLDALDGAFWADQDLPMQGACDALVILKMPGWTDSSGIMGEIAHAALLNQPVYGLEPDTLSLTRWGFG